MQMQETGPSPSKEEGKANRLTTGNTEDMAGKQGEETSGPFPASAEKCD